MATEEHRKLAEFVKKTHDLLRRESRSFGPEIAWQRHVTRNDVLQEYADSMQQLATLHWTRNVDLENGTYCRIKWIRAQCKEYFFHGGKEKYNRRELDIKSKLCGGTEMRDLLDCNSTNIQKTVTLLDVGSCYNPLAEEDMFDVTAIDLVAVPNKVLKCDFLSVPVGQGQIVSQDAQQILQLSQESFDAVLFSLFLEYLPCPNQRYICCEKAYSLLKPGGVLLLVSPDSKHVGANAKLMKSWRYVLSKLGFMRIKYEKLRHLHCLVFRKCFSKTVASRWADLQTVSTDDPLYTSETNIFIPQDFRDQSSKTRERTFTENYDSDDLSSAFEELPFATA